MPWLGHGHFLPILFKCISNYPTNFLYWLYSPLGPCPLIFSFMIILQTVGLLGRVISSSQGLCLNTGQHKHRINAYTHQTSVLWVGFEPTIPASERAKTVHALDRAATEPSAVSRFMSRIRSCAIFVLADLTVSSLLSLSTLSTVRCAFRNVRPDEIYWSCTQFC
jgi:hypothetical protein